MDKTKTLLVVAGPTAVGKTAAAIELARYFQTEIISADSRQFYKEMSIGTAKPSLEELAAAKHHFIGSHSITETFTVGDFEQDALKVIERLFENHNVVIMAGGSGLYVRAVCEGFDELPSAPPEVRENLNRQLQEKGITSLQEDLAKADPVYFREVDLNNPQRLIRALEVYQSTGKPFSSYRKEKKHTRPFHIVKIGLTMPREQLYDRINQRVELMMEDGLLEEVKALLPYRHLNALQTVGYTELFDYLDGKTDLHTAVELIKQHTRQFAKRQLTWFNKDKEISWTNPLTDNVVALAEKLINLADSSGTGHTRF
ncbi:tRNA (adenosine(37)-N6)-dimethylallyltransferase MiaA [Mucilaginibacter sp. RS28]|uniref:tRNA dimethylallyltransferase n=1 Tax=Mucilaginibacter straminoryzae TaxID=2932774 RepID=A0A9X1X2W4_9SPHI|nr:tRNA (adenosine(37)-N6)-dimethylallyltransferase MiaA [Mucilaginibacter straminoryzae]MCJ8210217.1 tRNA (adenosine(37)-N6)-dimethylallyltransferase MiaA [Mucilaginibacter straminoryzae]